MCAIRRGRSRDFGKGGVATPCERRRRDVGGGGPPQKKEKIRVPNKRFFLASGTKIQGFIVR